MSTGASTGPSGVREEGGGAGVRAVDSSLVDPAGDDQPFDQVQRLRDDIGVVDLLVGEQEQVVAGLDGEGDRVVVKPTPRDEMTKSGIVLPDTAKEKPQEGEILAVGPGAFDNDGKRVAMDVKVGQKVLYGKYAGTEFKIEEEDLLIVSQKDILAIVAD